MKIKEVKQKWQERARKLKTDTAALYLALKRQDTPLSAKVIIGITVCYALSPIDLVPDFIPVLGFLDDVLLLPLLIAAAIKLIPPQILNDCRRQQNDLWANGTPRRLCYAIPIIVIWLIIIAIIVKIIWF